MTRSWSLFLTRAAVSHHSSEPVNRAHALPQSESATPAGLVLAAIYDEHFDFLWRSLLRLGVSSETIDDAVQDVFLVVHRRLPEFEQRSAIRTWLFGIALRVAREHARRRRKHGAPREAAPELEDELAPNPLDQLVRSEAKDLLYALVAELDEQKRTVFVLAEIEGMSVPEIAAGLGENVNTLMSRLRAARKQFEAALARHRARAAFAEVRR